MEYVCGSNATHESIERALDDVFCIFAPSISPMARSKIAKLADGSKTIPEVACEVGVTGNFITQHMKNPDHKWRFKQEKNQ